MDCSRSSRSASGQINLRCLASSCACSSRFQRTSRTSMDFWPSGESIHSKSPSRKGLSAKILSCGCSRRCLPMRSSNRSGPSRPVLCWRGGASSGISIVPSRRRNTCRLRFPQRGSSRRIRIMSPNMLNELVIYGAYWVTRPNLNHGCTHAGSGAATIAVGYLVECNPSAAAGLLAPAHLHVVTAVAGLTVRVELLGVTSIVRALNLRPGLYTKLLDHFHSSGVKLDRLSALWAQAVLQLFPGLVSVNGRLVLVGDGIKAPKRGKKMPAVKLLHQQSESNTKPEYIMGHSMQAVGLLVRAAKSVFCVPLAVRIHEGLVWSNRDKRTLLDKMLGLIDILALKAPFYFVADAYYAAGKMARGLLKQGNHLVTRVKSNAVAYAPATPKKGKKTRGRPKTYGKKKKLKSLFDDPKSMQQIASPVYGERNVTLSYRVCDMLWRPVGLLVRFVAVIHPTRGACILMCTDTTLCAVDIIRLYGLRFKIECSFKQAVRQIGSFAYHFWMKDMIPLLYRNGNQYLHRTSEDYRNRVKRKMHAYHAFMQAGVVAQGLLQYLAVVAPKLVWDSFGSWLRTIRPGVPPSEFVVANALRQTLPGFLMGPAKNDSLTKFITDRQDTEKMRIFRLAS